MKILKKIKNYIVNYFKISAMEYMEKRSFTNGERISHEEAERLLKKIEKELK